jgi:hypothetical protein
MSARVQVFVLTYCRKIELLYGSELIFRTLRVGFPNAGVSIVDNASLPEARSRIAALARENDCEFQQIEEPAVGHHRFLEETLASVAKSGTGPLVFLDPDICLWEICEDLEFEGLIAGKMVEAHEDPFMQCVVMARLHTSFLWIPHPPSLQGEIGRIRKPHFDFHPFQPFSVKLGDAWIRYDTGASLFAALGERASGFEEPHLDRYDHIFCGTHIDLHEPTWDSEMREFMLRVHRDAREGNLESLRGIWREQRRVFKKSAGPLALRA